MKQIQGSERVKIKESVHVSVYGPNFFSFHLLSFSISFPELTIFTILRLYMACKMWKITAPAWEISSWRLVEKFHISAFPMYYSLYNWIRRAWSYKTKKKKNLLRSQKKWHKNKHIKTWMKWNVTKWTIWHFEQCACVNDICFAPVVTTTYRMKGNKRSTRGLSLEMSVIARARAQLLNMLYISTHIHLSVPHGENI